MMANIGLRCSIEVAKEYIPEQNRPPNRFLASALAAGPKITYVFGLKVEHRSTLCKYTVRGTPPFETQISLRYPVEDVSRAVLREEFKYCTHQRPFCL